MKPISRASIALTAAILAAAVSPAAAASAADAQTAPAAWQAVPVPSSVEAPANLTAVSAASPSAAWAVGIEAANADGTGTPLILHWNGTAWSKAALPGVPGPGYLASVAAASASDAWAAGSDASGAVVLHWNGRNWSTVSFPDQATATVASVAVAPNGTAWLAGGVPDSSGTDHSLVEEWNGKTWHVVNTGLAAGDLSVVRVTPSGEVFVGGSGSSGGNVVAYEQGGTWTALSAPPPVDVVNDVLGVSGSDVWVAGLNVPGPGHQATPGIANWNGSAWATPDTPANLPNDAFTISPDNAGQPQWVGASAGINPATTQYAYYDGTSWSDVAGATDVTGADTAYTETAHIPGTNATWAVGGTASLDAQGNPVPASPIIEYNP